MRMQNFVERTTACALVANRYVRQRSSYDSCNARITLAIDDCIYVCVCVSQPIRTELIATLLSDWSRVANTDATANR